MPSDQSKIGAAIKKLMELISIDLPSKGTPFPKIEGPKEQDKICIVGAGPAGIHMAVELKHKFFNNVKIFEETDRVGGKSYDTVIDGYYRFQGTVFLSIDYFDNVIEFANRYGAGELHPLDVPGVSTVYYEIRSRIFPAFYDICFLELN